MRPPRIAAEYRRATKEEWAEWRASMRPPRIAAEYVDDGFSLDRLVIASMRPPRIAAEYTLRFWIKFQGFESFNEAAANRGGIQSAYRLIGIGLDGLQ